MSYPPRPPLVPYGLAPGVVTMPMATHVMVGAYGAGGAVGGRSALLPAPPNPGKAQRQRTANGAKDVDGPPVTVFIGNISSRAPDAMIRAVLGACGAVLSWKRVNTFGFCEFAGPEAALRCVRLLHERPLADKKLLARTDGKMQALVDTYKTEQRSRMAHFGEAAPGTEGEGYLDAAQRALDAAAERRLQQLYQDYQEDINNYELLQKEEAISKTARVLEEADISEEKRDVIHREIGKFRESMKEEVDVVARRKRDKDDKPERERERERDKDRDKDKERERDRERERERDKDRDKDKERERDRERERDKDRRRRSPSRNKDRREERDKEREREREERDREREREREKEREKEREREREREIREREREREARERERERERDRER